jgi:hypothetical protein
MTVTGQCASHTLPRLCLLQPYEQYGAACISHATLFPRQASSSLILTDVILSFRTSVGLLTMYNRIYYSHPPTNDTPPSFDRLLTS